jgi:superfamily I DNA/RNA helicase
MDRVEEMRLCDEYFSKLDKRDFYNMFGEINLNTEKLQETFQPYLQEFNKRYKEYKQYHMLVSFSDMLLATPKVKYKYVIVDEAQDMTPLNWSFIQKLVKEGGTIYLAGDDDQNIYTFNGSDEQIMVNVATEKVILDQSYRVPSKIHEIATKHVRSISKRQDKIVKPTKFEGEVSYTNYFNLDSVTSPVTLLFRDNFLMKEVEKELLRLYLPFKKSKSKSYFDSYFAEAIRAWYSKDEAYLEKNNKFFIDTTADVKDVLRHKTLADFI